MQLLPTTTLQHDFDDGSCLASPYTSIADIQIGQETALFEGVAVLTSGVVTECMVAELRYKMGLEHIRSFG